MTPREFETSPLVVGAGELWPQTIHADFLSAIGDGNLPREAFERWLVQDYLFAQGLTTFEAIAVAKTPRPAQKILIAGLAAMDAEMDWFETCFGVLRRKLLPQALMVTANDMGQVGDINNDILCIIE